MNTYLIQSETIYFMEEKLKELKNGIDNIVTFNLNENTLNEVLEEASYMSMFDEKKCIIVKNAKFFGTSKNADTLKAKEDASKLLKYLEHENPYVRLIFTINGNIDDKKKIVNLLKENKHLFTYPNLTKTEIKNELKRYVQDKNFLIDDDSLWYIINCSNGLFDIALNEIKKIMLYYGKSTKIKYDDVLKLTSKVIEENNFKLVDSIINRDLDKALNYLKDAKILKVEPTVILALIYREFKLMLSVILYEEEKMTPQNILRELRLADWQYQKVKNNLRMYNKREIKEEIIKISKMDYELKSGLTNKDTMLLTYILDLCL